MIDTHERLIVALDVPSTDDARNMVEQLGDSVRFYKVGLELFLSRNGFDFVDWLTDRNKKVFVDLKLFDVPATVHNAVRQLAGHGITFTTVHGNDAIMQAAVQAGSDVQILAVTVLTSLDKADLNDLGFNCDVESLVLSRAKRAITLGCRGVIASGLEAQQLRKALGDKFLVVSPGIRPIQNDDDQKRVVTPSQAFKNGADYIVVGRPIRDADDPRLAAESILREISKVFDS